MGLVRWFDELWQVLYTMFRRMCSFKSMYVCPTVCQSVYVYACLRVCGCVCVCGCLFLYDVCVGKTLSLNPCVYLICL